MVSTSPKSKRKTYSILYLLTKTHHDQSAQHNYYDKQQEGVLNIQL